MREPFVTDDSGNHQHTMNFEQGARRDVNHQSNTVAFPARVAFRPPTDPSGNHNHEVTGGGDRETRPINAYVNWIIRVE